MMKWMINRFLPGAGFALALFLGMQLVSTSWQGEVFFYPAGSERDPAAFAKAVDFSSLKGVNPKRFTSELLIKEARLVQKEGLVGVSFGQYFTKGDGGLWTSVCDVYDRVSIQIHALGIAESGQVPYASIEADCRSSEVDGLLQPVWIPLEAIYKSRKSNPEFDIGNDDSKVSVQVGFMTYDRPERWELVGVRLFNSEDPSISEVVEQATIQKLHGSQFTFMDLNP